MSEPQPEQKSNWKIIALVPPYAGQVVATFIDMESLQIHDEQVILWALVEDNHNNRTVRGLVARESIEVADNLPGFLCYDNLTNWQPIMEKKYG
jgi:hypothetical protein